MSEREASLRVLARPAFRNREKNPYNWLLYSGLANLGVRVDEFSHARAAAGRYDIVHVHWPESTFNASLPEALATTRGLLLALDWQRARGAKVLWTAHNLNAHDRRFPRAEAAFWDAFIPRVDGFFALSSSGLGAARERFPGLAAKRGFVVPHHHYRGEYPDTVTRSEARARLRLHPSAEVVLFFGRVQAYKNVSALIRAFRGMAPALDRRTGQSVPETPGIDQGPVLLVAGKPHDRAVEAAVLSEAAGDPRVRLDLRFIAKEEAQNYFRAADLVVLPYHEILNSGSAVLALGFERPLLLPISGAGSDLRALVGPEWVDLYDRLDAARLAAALARATRARAESVEATLEPLRPERAVLGTLAAYRAILGRRGERDSDPRSAKELRCLV